MIGRQSSSDRYGSLRDDWSVLHRRLGAAEPVNVTATQRRGVGPIMLGGFALLTFQAFPLALVLALVTIVLAIKWRHIPEVHSFTDIALILGVLALLLALYEFASSAGVLPGDPVNEISYWASVSSLTP